MSNDDLVPRLRVLSGCTEEGYEADIIQKAADRIEALEVKNAKLREMVTAQAEGAAQQAKENARLRAAMAWQPIETAPRDGTDILACFAWEHQDGKLRFSWIANGYLDEEWIWTFSSFPLEADEFSNPTHWMPLPAAPEGE